MSHPALHFLDQTLHFLPQGAMYWPAQQTLVVADLHFGKAATFRDAGMALPSGGTQANLQRLNAALAATGAQRLLILGDLIHAKRGRSAQMVATVAAWRKKRSQLAIELVLGNHDRHAGAPPDEWGMTVYAEALIEPPFVWQHEPQPSADGYAIGGHVHPAVQLSGGGDSVRLPCFWFGRKNAILPAFGDFTGFGMVKMRDAQHLLVIADDEVIRVR